MQLYVFLSYLLCIQVAQVTCVVEVPRMVFENFPLPSNNIERNPKPVKTPTQYDTTTYPKVTIANGTVIGKDHDESHSFYNIPYAAPPTGPLRFMPPQSTVAYPLGTLNASVSNQLACQQIYSTCDHGECATNLNEDCLVLDIDVPSAIDLNDIKPANLLPVLFYIHGGFFFADSGTSYLEDGRWLCNATNTVVVTINYRLGALGFLAYKQGGVELGGNQGLKDQQLAMRWVQENIHKFGGDKDKITLFGNSAGAQAIMFHLVSSTSEPLFHQAIMQSNPSVFKYSTTVDSYRVTEYLMEAINCTMNLTCLIETDPITLVKALGPVRKFALLNAEIFNTIEPYRPVIDGYEFTDQPLQLIQQGKWPAKNFIIGTNTEELYPYVVAMFNNTDIGKLEFENFNKYMLGKEIGEMVNTKYEQLVSHPSSATDYTQVLGVELTDMFFTCPSRALARFASNSSRGKEIYLYDNSYPYGGPGCYAVRNNLDGVCGTSFHGSEVVFVFGSGPSFGMTFTDNDTKASSIFQEFWGNFAYNGVPSNEVNNVYGDWPKYQYSSSENTLMWVDMRIEVPLPQPEYNYRQDYCDFWDSTGYYANITGYEGSGEMATTQAPQTTQTKRTTPTTQTPQAPETTQTPTHIPTTSKLPTTTLEATQSTTTDAACTISGNLHVLTAAIVAALAVHLM
ncbi:crystal protein-like [Ciona intestinalis]